MNIHENLVGETVAVVMTDGDQLIIRTETNREFRIKWVEGEPMLMGIDVRIKLPGLSVLSGLGGLNGS